MADLEEGVDALPLKVIDNSNAATEARGRGLASDPAIKVLYNHFCIFNTAPLT